MIVERFAHSDVTAAPDSVALSRFHCAEPFGKTQKSSFNAGQPSLLWLFNVSHTQTERKCRIQSPCRVSIAQNPSARLRNPVVLPANDPFYGCLTSRTHRRNGRAGFSRPVAFPLPRTPRQASEIQLYRPANDPFDGCLPFGTLRRNGTAGFSHPVAFPSPGTLRQDSEIKL